MRKAALMPIIQRYEVREDSVAILAASPYEPWARLPGARLHPDRIEIVGINRQLSPLPGTTDSPVDCPGVNNDIALEFTGDFSITTRMVLPVDSDLYIEFWGYIPMVMDEWRAKNNMISFEFRRWGEWSGNNGTCYWTSHDQHWAEAWGDGDIEMGEATDEVVFTFQRVGNIITGTANGAEIMFLAQTDRDYFPDQYVYLSAYEKRVGESSYITHMRADAIGSESTVKPRIMGVRPIAQSTTSLRHFAQLNYPGTRIGSTVSAHPLAMDPQYAPILGREFNQITPENAMKFQMIQPQRGVFEFGEADMLAEYCTLNNTKMHGHCLVWQEAIPMWIHNGTFTAQEIQDIMVEHITTVVSRYKGLFESWDVINEPFDGFTSNLRSHVWMDAMGRDYIKIALHAAHAADPDALLFINEWACEEPGTKQDAMYDLFVELLSEGVPIHGMGFQMHEDMNADYQETWPDDTPSVDKAMLKAALARFKGLGLEVRVSELDVNLHRIYPTTLKAQAEYYRDMLEACLEEGAHTFCMWGFTDRWSSLQSWWDYHGWGNGLIYDVDYNPKGAYHLMNERLQVPPPS